MNTSASASSAAVSVVAGSGTGDASHIDSCRLQGSNQAASLRMEIGAGTAGQIVCTLVDFNGSGPVLVDVLGGGVVIVQSGMTNFSGVGSSFQAANGSFSIIFSAILQTGGSGWLVDADGATVICFDSNSLLVGNGFRGTNGAVVVAANATISNPPAGSLLDLDATSFSTLGNIQYGTGGNPYDDIVAAVPSNVLFTVTLNWNTGTLAQRPATPRPGMRFYATDQPVGARQLTFIPGTGWVDQTDTVVP